MNGLYLVTVPIGNSEDITLRALNQLKESKYIYCEDTRVFMDLSKRVGIEIEGKKVKSFHDHSSEMKTTEIIERAKIEAVCFVSDAGSPLLSDPAFPLIKAAIAEEINLQSLGGINAPVTALELSGLAPIPFHFHGFLARDNSKRNSDFQTYAAQYGTHIIFEGVSRVLETISTLTGQFPDYEFAIGRELTKSFQSIYRFKGADFESVKDSITAKGEFVILFHNPKKKDSAASSDVIELARDIISSGAKPKKLAKLLAALTGGNSKDIYSRLSVR